MLNDENDEGGNAEVAESVESEGFAVTAEDDGQITNRLHFCQLKVDNL